MIDNATMAQGGMFADFTLSAPNIFLFLVVAGVHLWFAAMVVWAIWIQRFIQANGETSNSSLTFFSWNAIRDYFKAKHGKQAGKPWFMPAFECLAGTGITCFFLAIAHVLWTVCV